MIISHRHKFIFLRTRKTAGTSIEIALSRFCGSKDVIVPIAPKDEKTRQALGYRGPQNYLIDWRFYRPKDFYRLLRFQKVKPFRNHSSASYVYENIDKKVWDSYFKFVFERNPYDKAVSRYYWSTSPPRPSIEQYVESAPLIYLSNWGTYTMHDQIAVDFVGRFESLRSDLSEVARRIGLPDEIKLPDAKSGHRPEKSHYTEELTPAARERVELVCAKEFAHFGYEWNKAEGATQ